MLRRVVTSWRLTQKDFEEGARPMLEKAKNEKWLSRKMQQQARLAYVDVPKESPRISPLTALKVKTPVFQHKLPWWRRFYHVSQTRPGFFARGIWDFLVARLENVHKQIEDLNFETKFTVAQKAHKHLLLQEQADEAFYKIRIQYEWDQFHQKWKIHELLGPLQGAVSGSQFIASSVEEPEPVAAEEEKPVDVDLEEEPSKGFTLIDAMRILDLTEKPGLREIEEKAAQLIGLNDPEKGGSPYLQKKVEEAAKRVTRALLAGEKFPEKK